MADLAQPAPIRFITGADHQYFDQIFLLLGSLRITSPNIHLMVCDFGLNDRQRDFLRRCDSLLEIPADLPAPRHPWDYKAAMGRYVAQLPGDWGPDDPICWLDSDLVILTDLYDLMQRLHASLVAENLPLAASGLGTLAEQQGVDPAPHYAKLIAGYDQALTYMNSGFFLCRSRQLLLDWHQQTLQMNLEMLYEQNAFNLVALREPMLRVLDPSIWNVMSDDLLKIRLEQHDGHYVVMNEDRRALVLHLTSSNRPRDLEQMRQKFLIGGHLLDCQFRLLRRQDFRPMLMDYIQAGLWANQEHLLASGLAVKVD